MNLIKLSFIAVLFSVVSFSAHAQNVRPKFKKFQFVTYRPSGKGDDKFIRLEVAMEINRDGMMHRVFNIFYDYFSSNLTYAGMLGGDTTYRVPDSLMSKLNNIFEDKPNLIQPTEFRKSHKKQDYHGPYMFISFTDNNGGIHNLIIADLFDINIEYRKILINFLYERSKMNRNNEPVIRDQQLETTILKYHNACKNLPKMVPVNPANMEVADPSVKH